jgi:hypothetical protein
LQSWSPEAENPTLAISDLLKFLSDYQQRGAALWRPAFLAILAQAYAATGQTAAARQHLQDAHKQMVNSGETMWQPVLERIESDLFATEA